MKLQIYTCPRARVEHRLSSRQYAHVGHYHNTICVAPSFFGLPLGYQMGIVGHEVGHLILLARGIEDHTETEADEEAERFFGFPIQRRDSRFGRGLEYLPSKQAEEIRRKIFWKPSTFRTSIP